VVEEALVVSATKPPTLASPPRELLAVMDSSVTEQKHAMVSVLALEPLLLVQVEIYALNVMNHVMYVLLLPELLAVMDFIAMEMKCAMEVELAPLDLHLALVVTLAYNVMNHVTFANHPPELLAVMESSVTEPSYAMD